MNVFALLVNIAFIAALFVLGDWMWAQRPAFVVVGCTLAMIAAMMTALASIERALRELQDAANVEVRASVPGDSP